VDEIYDLSVDASLATPERSEAPRICIDLPEHAEDLRFSDASLALGLSRDPSGALAIHGPLKAGEVSLALRYNLPAHGADFDFERRFDAPVDLLTVLVADTGVLPRSERLHRRRPVITDDRSYAHLEGFSIAPDEKVALRLERLDAREALPRPAAAGLVVALAVGALAFLSAPLRSQRQAAPELPESREAVEREAVYRAIEDLDDDLDTGKISAEDYERLRGELRARAVSLLRAERERAAARPAVAPPAPRVAYCASCGARVRAEDRFCSQCGGRLPDPSELAPPADPRRAPRGSDASAQPGDASRAPEAGGPAEADPRPEPRDEAR